MSWSVHSTVDEPANLLVAFAAHYLSLGAAEVHFCFDRKNEEAADILCRVPEVKITLCDQAYWKIMPGRERPISQANRQVLNLKKAYAESRHDWLMFCDADEFLHIDSHFKSVAEIVDVLSPDTRFHLFAPAERVYLKGSKPAGIFDGLYRLRNKPMIDAGPEIYGDDWKFFSRGLLQDGPGKSIMRVGVGIDVNIHTPNEKPKGKILGNEADIAALQRCLLLHYDGLTPLHWALKLARWYRSMIELLGNDQNLLRTRRTPGRNLQAEVLHLNRSDPAALIAMTHLQFLSAEQVEKLTAKGAILEANPQIETSVKRVFSMEPDYTQKGFDERLRRLHADFIAASGFDFWEGASA